ncbi:MAG TPA: GNAT family protein [Steroidobacteraceae bacterium]|jgi:RimJ/RimL family protein N-acetyltransferase|nr:GNAT family protein [Steroidobacteraceae bacterium]
MTPGLSVRTARLELIAATFELLEAELAGPAALGAVLGVPVPHSWPPGEYDRDALDFFLSRIFMHGPAVVGWYNWYAILLDADGCREALVAGAGYMGPPMEELVEIGYSVVPEARGRGFATEIVESLVTRALAVGAVRTVIAHTLVSNAASQAVLKRAGFQVVGPGAQPGVLRFERSRS